MARPRICSVTSPAPVEPAPAPLGALILSASALAWLRPIVPGLSAASGSVSARPSSTARLVSVPARSIVVCRPLGARSVAVCSSSGAACLTPGRRSTRTSRLFVEALAAAGAQLQGRRSGDGADDFAAGAGDARLSDRGREHERHGDRDPDRPRSTPAPRARAASGGRGRRARTAPCNVRVCGGSDARHRRSFLCSSAVAQREAAIGELRGVAVVGDEQHAGAALVRDLERAARSSRS